MAKYFKRGQREYYQVTPERVIRIVNKLSISEVTICILDSIQGKTVISFLTSTAEEGKEITRNEFAEQFKTASNLLTLDPEDIPIDNPKCSFCGWPKSDHRRGKCYHYSDEDTDYFYKDKEFKA